MLSIRYLFFLYYQMSRRKTDDLISAYYLIGLPIAIFLAFHKTTHLGLGGLWLGLAISLVYCAAVGVWICLRADWDWEVIVVAKRLQAAKKAARHMAVGSENSSTYDEVEEVERAIEERDAGAV
jgi:hypothetical protein